MTAVADEGTWASAGAAPRRRALLARAGGRLALAELLAVVVLVPLVWFPWRVPWLTLAALPVLPALWLVRWRQRGRLATGLGVELPLVFVLAAACAAAWPVVDWLQALPKLLGLALGAWMLVGIGHWVRTRQALELAVLALAALAVLLAVVGVLGAEWLTDKAPLLAPFYRRLPAVVRGVVPNTPEGGIHPNELAGTLALVAPPLLAQAGVPGRTRWVVVGAGLLASLVLLLTQSRSGIAGFTLACAAGGGWLVWQRSRGIGAPATRLALRGGYGLLVLVAVALAGRLATAWVTSDADLTSPSATQALSSFQGRVELWQRGALMAQDFSVTGIGLGQFNAVFQRLYLPVQFGPAVYVPHAHNLFLEYALELGVPGFVACAALVVGVVRLGLSGARAPDRQVQCTAIGLLLGLLAFAVFGLTDALAPGARAGLVLWIVLGLCAATGHATLVASEPIG